MTPEEKEKLNSVVEFIENLKNTTTIPLEVDQAFRDRLLPEYVQFSDLPDGFSDAPLDAVTAPTGGATVDTNARTAINDIITRLEDLGLIDPN